MQHIRTLLDLYSIEQPKRLVYFEADAISTVDFWAEWRNCLERIIRIHKLEVRK